MADVKLNIGLEGTEKVQSELKKLGDSVKTLQAELNKGMKLPAAAPAGSPGYQAFQQAFQATRAQETKTKNEQQAQQVALTKLKDIDRQLATNARNEAKSDRDKKFAEQERNSLLKERITLQGTLNRLEGKNQNGQPIGGQGPRFPGGTGLPGDLGKSAGGLGGLAIPGIIAGVTTALVQGINQIAGSPSRTLSAGGSAVSGTVGREFSSLYNGNLPAELAFTKEKREAKEMANKQEAANRASDTIREGAAVASGITSAVLVAGGITSIGAAATGAAGMFSAFGSQRMRAKTTANIAEHLGFGGYAKEQRAEYENLMSQQNMEDFRKNYEAKKQLNPLKSLAVEEYNRNSQRDLEFQRQMGLNTQSFRGTFKNEAFNAGFTGEQAMGAASGIIGAGGSTRSAVGNATLALQAQRNLDITNASGVLGKLSGGLGSAETTKEGFVKLLAEGTKVGLDGSDFREENRKFIESAADMVSKSGVTTGAGMDQLLSQFGKFFGDKTMTGIEAGKGAFELYRQTSMATTGPRAMMRAGGMLTDPIVSQLGRNSREALFNMPIDQLTPDNPAIIAMASEAHTTPQALIDAQNKITSRSANLFKASDTARDKLRDVKKKYGMSSAIGYQGPYSSQAYSEVQEALGQSNIAQIREHPELGQDQRKASAYSNALASDDANGMNKALEEAKAQKLGSNAPTGRPEDETNRIKAEMSRQVNQIFMDLKDTIVPAADAAANFVEQIKKLNAEMMALPENQRAPFANKNILPIYGPTTQPSSGSPSSGGGSGS